jgi:GMP synthase-like glutamine amidotransferase
VRLARFFYIDKALFTLYYFFVKKILVIQSYKDKANEAGEQRDYVRTLGNHAELVFISTLDTSLSWDNPEQILNGYQGVVFGGSSDFDFDGGRDASDPVLAESLVILERVRPIVAYVLQTEFPCMGICYGHQIIGKIQGGTVRNDKNQNKLGTFSVTLTPKGVKDKLFGQMPPVFLAQYDHKDSLTELPESAVLLGSGERCRFSILRYGSSCYTIQFHVEFTENEMRAEYRDSSERFPVGVPVEDMVKPSPEASTLLPLFVKHCT